MGAVWAFFALAFVNVFVAAFTGSPVLYDFGARVFVSIGSLLVGLLAAAAVLALFVRGTEGRNRHGPDPLRRVD